MTPRRLTSAFSALVLTGTALATTSGASQAAAQLDPPPARSLAQVLAADGHGFDKNPRDFDIIDRFVTRILAAKPDSRLGVLTKGGQRLTAFVPTDGAFRRTAAQILEQRFTSERQVFRALWSAGGVRTSERILLHHLVLDHTLTFQELRHAAPVNLRTMQGGRLHVRLDDKRLMVIDDNPESPNAHVIRALRDINKGNRQIAHGINWLLSPD